MRILLILLTSFFISCETQKEIANNDFISNIPSAPALVYKTTKNYNNNVPIILSEDKKEIVSYPAPTDLKVGSNFALPTKLKNGYLLDNRGISKNVAFLKLTYQEFSNLEKAPSTKELMDLIIDDNPLKELYKCGLRSDYKNIEPELNNIITKKELNKFEKLK
ncbi:MAG: hypothetical protein JXA16_04965 [Bacteroidales bacterium]|nr:hypothetical protein [Bacteroidales bacterium]